MDYKLLIDQVIDLDQSIRFAIISDMYGNIVNTRHREGLDNFLSDEETRDSLQYSVEAWRVRNKHANKIGKGRYALVEYEKIRRITIPIGEDRILLLTMDNVGNHFEVLGKILDQMKFPKS